MIIILFILMGITITFVGQFLIMIQETSQWVSTSSIKSFGKPILVGIILGAVVGSMITIALSIFKGIIN